MTAKEAHRMKRLEIENRELRQQLDKNFQIYRDQLYLIVEMKTKLELIDSALHGGNEE